MKKYTSDGCRIVRVFVASPTDVTKECELLKQVVDSLNRRLANHLGVFFQLAGWKEVVPDLGRPEKVILTELPVRKCDIFIGFLWQRFGTPPGRYNRHTGRPFFSGTEEEFEEAYGAWKKTGRPHIMVYTCTRQPENPSSQQYSRVCRFFRQFRAGGKHPGLFQDYRNHEDFVMLVWEHLEHLLVSRFGRTQSRRTVGKGKVAAAPVRAGEVRKLNSMVPLHFLQVLVPGFELSQNGGRQRLVLEIGGDLPFITNRQQREQFRDGLKAASSAKKKLDQDLQVFQERKGRHKLRINCPNWPLRHANGGALPIVVFNSRKYICLFYREVFPAGWNIANGASDNHLEILEPERTISREFGEELLVACESRQTLYTFNLGKKVSYPGYQTAAIAAWDTRFPERGYRNYQRTGLDVCWVDGPDTVRVSMEGTQHTASGVFLNLTTHDNAIEIDRVVYVNLPSGASLLDGEIAEGTNDIPVGRIVGLFEFDGFKSRLNRGHLIPDKFFFEGRECDGGSAEFHRVRTSFIEQRHAKGPRAELQRILAANKGMPHLCPIANSMVALYSQCLKRNIVAEPRIWLQQRLG
jgi:hypothetical protein